MRACAGSSGVRPVAVAGRGAGRAAVDAVMRGEPRRAHRQAGRACWQGVLAGRGQLLADSATHPGAAPRPPPKKIGKVWPCRAAAPTLSRRESHPESCWAGATKKESRTPHAGKAAAGRARAVGRLAGGGGPRGVRGAASRALPRSHEASISAATEPPSHTPGVSRAPSFRVRILLSGWIRLLNTYYVENTTTP